MKIKKLTLATTDLPGQVGFYRNTLGFKLLKKNSREAEFRIGNSVLRFESAPKATPYHFAFNIPSFQEKQALDWLKARVEVLKDASDEIIPFDFWNARAIYFYDKDQNIVEFIARRNLGFEDIAPFSAESVIEISEIGIPVDDIVPIHDHLTNELNLEVYSGSTDRFCAIGDERGLFIIINKTIKTFWFPTEDTPHSSDLKAVVYHQGQLFNITFQHETLFSHELKSNHHSFNQLA